MTRLRGTVRDAVEAGGRLLDADGTAYLLLGDEVRGLRAGEVVEVRGEMAGVRTVFQQGVPFRVAAVIRGAG